MNEEKKKSEGMSLVAIILLIVALFAGIKLVFWGVEKAIGPGPKDLYPPVAQENGRDSAYGMRLLTEEEREQSDVEIWLDQIEKAAEEEEPEDTVYWLYRQAEDDYVLYLPEQDRALTNADLTADEKRQEDGEMTLVLRVRTPEDGEEVEPEEQLLCFRTNSENWRGIRVRVLMDGREQTVEKRVSVGPEIHTVEEVYIGRF